MEYIWKDRKRHLGLPLSFTRYALSEDRLFLSVGFFSIKDEEILLYRIRDISTSRSLWQRMFGVGSITVVSSDKTAPTLLLKNVKNPLDVKEMLHQQVEKVKIQRRIRLGEIMTDTPEDLPEESDAQWHEDDME
ncbi:MAG TPA: PH domain-containing protein [Candidatus Faecousia excrementigallinarum]|uniref:PH domain-containing protein n=1 Tax=Candidatus Faecousia excrementigallinarum TaxID=2840806 RepID=A0A9D0Z679_9FIRM|nr:PH domain-containing protein [Candidatus Faecousia excrementigallinarum]